ncbi:MAG TPA: NADH:ubiquinone oxidoreductase subunit N, partial [Gammaproteobacteria bacterium]|nr:NADH:ubiquinone oxidoreductase subunit N [Gammaproteobacteria bacterium]
LALVMLVVMFSMAGVPPTVGFFAKLSVIEAIIAEGFTWLAVVAVLFSVIGAFYYLRIVKLIYFDEVDDPSPIEAAWDEKLVVSLNGAAVLLLGLFPGGLLAVCGQLF